MFSGAVNQPKPALRIECENGDVDLRHDGAKQGRRFKSAQPLGAKRFTERVDLEQDLAEGVVHARAASADRIIPFPQSGEQVRHRLQRTNDVFPRAGDKAQGATADQQRQRPLHLGGIIAEPEERERDQRGGRDGPDDQPGDASFEAEAMPQLSANGGPGLVHPPRRASLQSIVLQPAIERAPAQAQGLGGLARVAIETAERFLNQERFHFLQAHVFDAGRILASTR